MKGLLKFKQIFLYSDSEPNEVLIGLLHAVILPFAMFELGDPYPGLQVIASIGGLFQLYAVLWDGGLFLRRVAVQLAVIVAIATVINYFMAGMLSGSHLGWLLILVFAMWNLVRVAREEMQKKWSST